MKIINVIKSVTVAATLVISSFSFAADVDVNANANDLAIHGYDAVSYFTESKASKGSHKYTATYKSAIYQFSSEENRELFQDNPEKFAPQFGGFCAMGVALNRKLDIDPAAWEIVDEKLYLNLNKAVQKKWLSDVPTHLETANRVWSGIQGVSITQLNAE
jgi:YHS domain-containing protein